MFQMDEDIIATPKPYIRHHMIWQLMQERMYPARKKHNKWKSTQRGDLFPPHKVIHGFDINPRG